MRGCAGGKVEKKKKKKAEDESDSDDDEGDMFAMKKKQHTAQELEEQENEFADFVKEKGERAYNSMQSYSRMVRTALDRIHVAVCRSQGKQKLSAE